LLDLGALSGGNSFLNCCHVGVLLSNSGQVTGHANTIGGADSWFSGKRSA